MPYILSLDQGTTSSRALLFDHDGAVRLRGPARVQTDLSPSPDGSSTIPKRSRHRKSPSLWKPWPRPTCSPATSPLSASPTSAKPRSSGIARPASPSTTPLSGRIAAPLRSASSSRRRVTKISIQQRTGLLIDAYFSASKISWILEHVPERTPTCRSRPSRHLAPWIPGCFGS